jgi:uncharacterized protein (DUF2141 family)
MPGHLRVATAVAAALLAASPAASPAQGTLRGTVHAPAGESVQGATVVACFVENGRCSYGTPHRNSRAVRIDARGGSAPFLVRDLAPGEYVVLGTRDVNGNGVEDAGGITWTPQRDWMTFFPDGRVHLAKPPHGLAVPFDWEGECSAAPAWCATYSVRGDEVRIRWLTGSERVLHVQSDGSLRTTDRLDYLRHDPLNGRRLEGRYLVPWKQPYQTVAIEFTRDGRFSEENLLDNIGWMTLEKHHDPAVAALVAVPRGSGTYSLRDNTLELRYADGRVARIVAYVFPQELRKTMPDEIYISGHDFRRVR